MDYMAKPISVDLFLSDPVAARPLKPRSRQSQLGQYLTPDSISTFMAELFPSLPGTVRLLDAGAGTGILTAAFVARWQKQRNGSGKLVAHAYELDEPMLESLRQTAEVLAQQKDIDAQIIEGDFIKHAATMLRLERGPRYTHAILNPPYKKINSLTDHRAFLRGAGLETVNLYSGFVGLAVAVMEKGGEVVAIIPRSFCNGPYYQPFRRFAGLAQASKPVTRVADPPLRDRPTVQPTARPIAREAMPAAANSTIRARSRIRASLFRDPANASSAWRSSLVRIIVAGEMNFIPATNHDSSFNDSGY